MISSFFNKSKFNYLFLIIIIIFSVPIFFAISIIDLNISILTGVGYVSQQMGYTLDDFVGIVEKLNEVAISLSAQAEIVSYACETCGTINEVIEQREQDA